MIARRAAQGRREGARVPGPDQDHGRPREPVDGLRRVTTGSAVPRHGLSIGSRPHGRLTLLHRRRRPDRRRPGPLADRDAQRQVPLRRAFCRSAIVRDRAARRGDRLGAVELARNRGGATRLEEANARPTPSESAAGPSTNQEAGSAPADTPADEGAGPTRPAGESEEAAGGGQLDGQPGLRRDGLRKLPLARRARLRRAGHDRAEPRRGAGRQGRDVHRDLDRRSERLRREGLPRRDDAAATYKRSADAPSRSRPSSPSCRRPPATDRSAASRALP